MVHIHYRDFNIKSKANEEIGRNRVALEANPSGIIYIIISTSCFPLD